MITSERLDVTQIEPRLKHPTIFEYFDALEKGEAVVIDNDHDPKPLYYELLGERGNIFTWEYLQEGPEWWSVRIAKSKKDAADEPSVGAIAAKDLRKAQILKEKGIEFSCGQHKTLKEAAEEADIGEEELREALENPKGRSVFPPSHDYQQWTVGFLLEYLVHVHHRYGREQLSLLSELSLKVAERHGDQHPELKKLAYASQLFLNDLKAHMDKEEEFLFPAIRHLCSSNGNSDTLPSEQIRSAVLMLEKEHMIAMEDLTYFRNITGNYHLPTDACNSWSHLYRKLQEFEEDWKHHVHMENNILFPRVAQLLEEKHS